MGGSNIHLKGVLEEANKENEKKAIFDKLLAKNFFLEIIKSINAILGIYRSSTKGK